MKVTNDSHKHDSHIKSTAQAQEGTSTYTHNVSFEESSSLHNLVQENLLFTRYIVKTPKTSRTFAAIMVLLFFVIIGLLFWVPWVQTVNAKGRVTSLAPNERPQFIQAQISGRLVKWNVREGQVLNAGDTIAILQDIDPKFLDQNLLENTSDQLRALEQRAKQAEQQISQFTQQVVAETKAKDAAVASSEQAYQQAIQRKISLQAQVRQEELNMKIATQRYKDRKELFDQGLRSQREFERAAFELQEAETRLDRVKADLQAALSSESQAQANIINKQAEGNSKILKSAADEAKARETLESINNSISKSRSDYNNASQRRTAGTILATTASKVVRLYSFGQGETVKQGDVLAIISPLAQSLAVELFVSGNDAPLIRVGNKVRVQFDGFPAFQISGFPGATVGTYGGEVVNVDAIDDDKARGTFRVLIKPNTDTDENWPTSEYLRPGTQASGWLLLNTVSLGWELWREFNGFPPSIVKPADANSRPKRGGSSSSGEEKKDDE